MPQKKNNPKNPFVSSSPQVGSDETNSAESMRELFKKIPPPQPGPPPPIKHLTPRTPAEQDYEQSQDANLRVQKT